jgi:hypothetical protein
MTAPIGQLTKRVNIINITNALPCEVTTQDPHLFNTGNFVRLTDLNGAIPVLRGQDPLNNYKFRIIVTGEDKFILEDPITHKEVDSTNYPPYVEGGSCNLVQQTFIYYPSPQQTYPN